MSSAAVNEAPVPNDSPTVAYSPTDTYTNINFSPSLTTGAKSAVFSQWEKAHKNRLVDSFIFPSESARLYVPHNAIEAIAAVLAEEQTRCDSVAESLSKSWVAVEDTQKGNERRLKFLTKELPELLKAEYTKAPNTLENNDDASFSSPPLSPTEGKVKPDSVIEPPPTKEKQLREAEKREGRGDFDSKGAEWTGPSSSSSPKAEGEEAKKQRNVFWTESSFRIHYGLTSILDDVPLSDLHLLTFSSPTNSNRASSAQSARESGPETIKRLAESLASDESKRDRIMKKKGWGSNTATATKETVIHRDLIRGVNRYAPLRRCFTSLLQNRAAYPKEMTLLFNAIDRVQPFLSEIEKKMEISMLHVPLYKPLQRIALCIARDLSRQAPGVTVTSNFASKNNEVLSTLARAMAELYYFYEKEVEEVPAEATAAKGQLGACMWSVLLTELEARKRIHERAVTYIVDALAAEEAQTADMSKVLEQCAAEVESLFATNTAEASAICAAAKETSERVDRTVEKGNAIYAAQKKVLESQIHEMSYRVTASSEAQVKILRSIRQLYKSLEKEQSVHTAAMCDLVACNVSLARLEADFREFSEAAEKRKNAMTKTLEACDLAEKMILDMRNACGELQREMTLHANRQCSSETSRKCSATRVTVDNLIEWRRVAGDLAALYQFIDDDVNLRRTVPLASLPSHLQNSPLAVQPENGGEQDGEEVPARFGTAEVVIAAIKTGGSNRDGDASDGMATISASSWQLDYLLSNARKKAAEKMQFIKKEVALLEQKWSEVEAAFAVPYEVTMPHRLAVDSDAEVIANRRLLIELETARKYMRTKEGEPIVPFEEELSQDPAKLLALFKERGFIIPAGGAAPASVGLSNKEKKRAADAQRELWYSLQNERLNKTDVNNKNGLSHISAAAEEEFRKATSPFYADTYPIAGAGPIVKPSEAESAKVDAIESDDKSALAIAQTYQRRKSSKSGLTQLDGKDEEDEDKDGEVEEGLLGDVSVVQTSTRTLRDPSLIPAAKTIIPTLAKFEAEMAALRNAHKIRNVSDYSKKSNRNLDEKATERSNNVERSASEGSTTPSSFTGSVAASSTPLTMKLQRSSVSVHRNARAPTGAENKVSDAIKAAGTAAALMRSQYKGRRASQPDPHDSATENADEDYVDGGSDVDEDSAAPPPPPRASVSEGDTAARQAFVSYEERNAALQQLLGAAEKAPIVPRPPPRRH